MAISYRNSNKINRIVEPLFQIDRVKFKSPRNSLAENNESNLIKIDLSRILKEHRKLMILFWIKLPILLEI